jgi:UDP-N-acetylglucosamine--N-acetylmuramyl-(pentapeptide) pyrophosphoryl-undecaprenol N-acetylglucosamine transferase
MRRHRVIITGGGTGGHIYPALAVCEQLKNDPDVDAILYVGAKGKIEEKLAAERNIDFVGLPISGMPRTFSIESLSWPFKTLGALKLAGKVFKQFKPTVVLGTGGYASAPSLWCGALLSIPLAIHEPDSHPGLVNKLFAGKAQLVSLGMEGALERFATTSAKIVVNGNPVSNSFVRPIGREEACAGLGIRDDLKTVLITGGSQGAKAINEAIIQALPLLLGADRQLQIIHQVGVKNFEDCKKLVGKFLLDPRYCLKDYIPDLSVAYACSDLTVCRSGAMTIAEIAMMGVPAIFIPYPYAAQNHQSHNAYFVANKGAAVVLEQFKVTGEKLARLILDTLGQENSLNQMQLEMRKLAKPQAAVNLANQIKDLSNSLLSKQKN